MSIKEFQVISKLGEGAYSSVYKVKRIADGQEYALKKVKLANLSDKEKQNALNEVRILASIRNNNIIQYKEAFVDEPSNSLCIIMEYANNGDLYQKIVDNQKNGTLFSEHEIWNILIQVVKGLKALHDLKILHRDLKSANVFINKDGTVKLGDMNVSKVAKKGLLYTQTGTPYYASPEVWKDQPYDNKSDIWSLGCVVYEMTTLKPPFRAEDMEGLYKKVIRGVYPKIQTNYSSDLSTVIKHLLQVAPHLRPSADQILQMGPVLKRLEETHLIEPDEGNSILLQTIRIPKNFHYLTDLLPKPNYALLKTRKLDKQKFVSTLATQRNEESISLNNPSTSVDNSKVVALPKISQKGGLVVQSQQLNTNEIQLERPKKKKTPKNKVVLAEQIEESEQQEQNQNQSLIQNQNKVIRSKQNNPKDILEEIIMKYQQKMENNHLSQKANEKEQLNLIYGIKKKQKKKKILDIDTSIRHNKPTLDIEGESKPILQKQQKNLSILDSLPLLQNKAVIKREILPSIKDRQQSELKIKKRYEQ